MLSLSVVFYLCPMCGKVLEEKCWPAICEPVGEVLGHKELGLVVFTAGWPEIAGNRA